ncbi:MAG TPA: universal stress protein [Alphaproteobacteria bacterium]
MSPRPRWSAWSAAGRQDTREKPGAGRRIRRGAPRERADRIVMGMRGLGRIRGLLMGSIATQVVALAPMPVTLVK